MNGNLRPDWIGKVKMSVLLIPLLLAAVAFVVYLPSLKSGFVYDARIEILEEGFIPNISNLHQVLTLKVLGMKLMLGDRPGQLLYLMGIAFLSGQNPLLYHLCGNLLHAANAALLYLFLRRLIVLDTTSKSKVAGYLDLGVSVACVLVFAVHPIAVESVANISYSSDLLVTFFTLVALIAATFFRAGNERVSWMAGILAVVCSFLAVSCKESGAVVPVLLLACWALFRRDGPRLPWLLFLGASAVVTLAFLAARFALAPATPLHPTFLGGSFAHFLLIQPRLWIYMAGKILYPVHLSADYTADNIAIVSLVKSLAGLAVLLSLQVWLSLKSRIGAMGVAIYWLGLATVSNFIPLFIFVADRYYYLPLAGVALQLFALVTLTLKLRWELWAFSGILIVALLFLTRLTILREKVFASEISLWSATLQVSPTSSITRSSLGDLFLKRGQLDQAIFLYMTALKLNPGNTAARTNLGDALMKKGKVDQAVEQFKDVAAARPDVPANHLNLGNALMQKGELDEAILQFRTVLKMDPANSQSDAALKEALFKEAHALP